MSDVRMPDISGLDLQRELLQAPSGAADPDHRPRRHRDGGWRHQGRGVRIHREAVRHRSVAGEIRQAIEEAGASNAARTDRRLWRLPRELSLRQRQVMALVAQGHSNKEIAHKLGLSPRTVENYRAWVMENMGATNLAELVSMVVVLETSGIST